MIVSESDVHHGSDDDLAVPHHGPLEYSVHTKDGRLGRIDDWCSEQGTKHAAVAKSCINFNQYKCKLQAS